MQNKRYIISKIACFSFHLSPVSSVNASFLSTYTVFSKKLVCKSSWYSFLRIKRVRWEMQREREGGQAEGDGEE